ncbi:MAG: metalloregulator ArsR/SmtB family transcription factor [Acidobacteriota bacterium]
MAGGTRAKRGTRVGKGGEFDPARFFVALSDRTRLRLINLMQNEEVCVCFFVEVLGESQPKVSRHLAYLRRAGIVAARRDGKWIHYRLTPPAEPLAARILADVLSWLKADDKMRQDRAQLVKVCCAISPPVPLLGAPKPATLTVAS